ncbi:MAG: monovalent cation/H+ antiporter complex subunit F [Caulobacterales bacterium]|jgi:multicomponent Na+:H+ antiporter subunit F
MIAAIALACLVLAAAVVVARLLAGPTLYDRALAALSINIKLALALAAGAVVLGQPALIDQAILQVILGFVVCVAVLKTLRFRSLQSSLEARSEQEGEA